MKKKQLVISILITVFTGLLAALGGLLSNLASSELPSQVKPYLPFAWPLLGGVTLALIVLTVWQVVRQSHDGQKREPRHQQRLGLLRNVRQFVIQSIEESLHEAALVPLGLREQPDAIAHPLGLLFEQPDRPARPLPPGIRITQVYDDAGGKLLILGEPGAGKTTLLLELARRLLKRASEDHNHPIPVVLNLSSWAIKRQPLADWLVEELRVKYGASRSLGEFWVEADQILPLLDGLDEVDPTHRAACVESINAYLREHGLVSVAVCCRSADYQTQPIRVLLQNAVIPQPLTPQQVDAYLLSMGGQVSGLREALLTDHQLRELATSPLMLSVMTLAYQGLPAEEVAVAASSLAIRRQEVLAAYIQSRLKHRRRQARYPPERTLKWLAWLASQMVHHNQTEFYLERMQPDWLPESQTARWFRGRIAGFFNGLQGGLRTGMLSGLIGLLSVSLLHWLSVKVPFEPRSTLLVLVALGFVSSLLVITFIPHTKQSSIELVDGVRWSWTSMRQAIDQSRPKHEWGSLLTGFLLFGLSFGAYGWLRYGFAFGLPFGLVSGLLGSLLVKLNSYLPLGLTGKGESIEHTDTRPNQRVWLTAWSGLRVGVVSGLCVGVVSGLSIGSVSGLYDGILFGVLLGSLCGFSLVLYSGGRGFLQHFTLRWLLWRSGSMPWKEVPFLNYAAELILLRRTRGSYVFLHRLLLEYFALLDLVNQPSALNALPTQRTLLTYRGHSNAAHALSWSPHGTVIASWGDDKAIQIWKANTGERVWMREHAEPVIELVWSSDGWLIASRTAKNMVQVWDVTPAESFADRPDFRTPRELSTAAWSPDGNRIASWTRMSKSASLRRQARVWNTRTGTPLSTHRNHTKDLKAVAWSPNRTQIASASADQSVQIWNAETGGELLTYRGHSGAIEAVAWSPDGIRIASGGEDGTIKVWSAATGETLQTYHTGRVSVLTWSPDGIYLASMDEGSSNIDTALNVWEVNSGKAILTRRGYFGSTKAVAWSPDSKHLAYSKKDIRNSDGTDFDYSKKDYLSREDLLNVTVEVLEVKTGTSERELANVGPYTYSVEAITWSLDDTRIITQEGDETMRVWEAGTGKLLLTYKGLKPQPPTVAWSPDGSRLAAPGTLWGSVRTLPIGKWKTAMEVTAPTDVSQPASQPIVAWSPDDTRFALAGGDHTILICDAAAKTVLLTYRGHVSPILAVAWSPEGTRIASGSKDGQVQIWEVATGNYLLTYGCHSDAVYALAWSPDGMRIASASADKTIQVWVPV